jgi:cell division initiation protein
MEVTHMEVRQHQFSLRFRGYDPTAVDIFLDRLAGRLEELVKENAKLREALARKDQEIQDIRAQEKDWKKALLAVQQTREDLITSAQQQAQLLMAEAHRKAQQMLMAAEQQHDAIANEVRALTRQRRQLVLQLRSLLEQHLKQLGAQREECAEKRPKGSQGRLVSAV